MECISDHVPYQLISSRLSTIATTKRLYTSIKLIFVKYIINIYYPLLKLFVNWPTTRLPSLRRYFCDMWFSYSCSCCFIGMPIYIVLVNSEQCNHLCSVWRQQYICFKKPVYDQDWRQYARENCLKTEKGPSQWTILRAFFQEHLSRHGDCNYIDLQSRWMNDVNRPEYIAQILVTKTRGRIIWKIPFRLPRIVVLLNI